MFFADVVVCVFQELVRKGNKLNKLIAKNIALGRLCRQ